MNINFNTYRSLRRPDKGYNDRIRFLVMHYTAANFSASVNSLTGGAASAHYLVPDPTDPSYIAAGFKGQQIFNLVDEKDRAWHAGISTWGNRTNLNDSAIGIEIVNQATDVQGVFTFPPFNDRQIEAVKALSLAILQRYSDISPTHVVGHADIAVGRKSDPGAAFPWKTLFDAGVGAWYDEEMKSAYMEQFTTAPLTQADMLIRFKKYGYDTSGAATDSAVYKKLVRAFQLHFRQSRYDGELDIETSAILAALVKKYFNYPAENPTTTQNTSSVI